MSDYWGKIQEMDSDKLFEEIKKLNDKLYKMDQNSPMFQQVRGMLDMCSERQSDLMARIMENNDKTPDVLEIGEIESVVYTPEYSEQELITTLSNFYTQKKEKKPLTVKPEQTTQTVSQSKVEQQPQPSSEFTIEVPKFGAKK
jgi:hypothetical protein